MHHHIKKKLQRCWKTTITGAEHLPSFYVSTLGHLDSLCVPTLGNLPSLLEKKANPRGLA